MPSFTTQLPDLHQRGPIFEARFIVPPEIEKALTTAGKPLPALVIGTALIDTGATNTVIDEDIPGKLGLNPVGVTNIRTATTDSHPCLTYSIRIVFPAGFAIRTTAIAAKLKNQGLDALIGREILRMGTLWYNGYNGTFTFGI